MQFAVVLFRPYKLINKHFSIVFNYKNKLLLCCGVEDGWYFGVLTVFICGPPMIAMGKLSI